MRAVEQGFAATLAQYRAEGWTVEHGAARRTGWPFFAMLQVPDVHLAGGRTLVPGGVDWRAHDVQFGFALAQPRTVRIELAGQQNLHLLGREIPFTADTMMLRVFVEPGVPPRTGVLETSMLRAGIGGGALVIGEGRIGWEMRPAATEAETSLSTTLQLGNILLPVSQPRLLGETIARFEVEAALIGPLPSARSSFMRRVGVWREEGGTVRVQRVDVQWGVAHATASATLALDEGLQPMGAANLRVADAARVLSALAADDLLPWHYVPQVMFALEQSRQTVTQEDGLTVTEVPLTLQNRVLSMGGVTLLQLPELNWQGED